MQLVKREDRRRRRNYVRKTGTAEHGDASSTTPHAWFVGFSNVEDPDIVVSVIAEESGSGSEVAVPIAQKIFDAYYNN